MIIIPLQLLASQTSIHTEESPAPRETKMEFNGKTGQTVPVKCRARPAKPTDHTHVYIRLPPFSPSSLCFSKIFPPQPPLSLPFPACGSSPKYPMISFAQSPNALSLQPIMCPVLPGSVPPQSARCYRDTLSSCRHHFLSV